jgi:hypothetical protein
MPDYESVFICMRGDVDTAFLDAPEFNVLEDSLGRSWVCRELPFTPAEVHAGLDAVTSDIISMQKKLTALGIESEGADVKIRLNRQPEGYTRDDDIQSLREWLAELRDIGTGEE